MDDDVLLEPEILIRLTAFAACTTHPTIVGGQMLNLLHPAHLHICAEYAEPESLQVGRAVPGALRRPTCSGTTSASCRSTRTAASTPSTTAGGPA